MAWGVRFAQSNQRRGLILCMVLTLLCALTFLGVKYVEYRHKWQEGLLWASKYDPKGEAASANPAKPAKTTKPASCAGRDRDAAGHRSQECLASSSASTSS